MSSYYLEYNDQVVDMFKLKGNILQVNNLALDLSKRFAATRIWREASDGSVYWIKNREQGMMNGLRLNKTELDEFVWIKLSAHVI